MAPELAETRAGRSTRVIEERVLALLAVLVAVAEALVLFAEDAPTQHRWLAAGLVVAAVGVAVNRRIDAARRGAWLGFLAGAAVAIRATVRFDSDLPALPAALDFGALLGAALAGVLALLALARAVGRSGAVLAGLTGVMVLACLGLVLERSPGAQLGIRATPLYKGPWPHRTFGQWYPPHSRVRSFYASNPRDYLDPPAQPWRYWRLSLNSADDSAALRFEPTKPGAFRVEIARAGSGEPWGIQLNQGPLVVRGGIRYELRFRARADRARQVNVAISEWHPPWDGLGYGRTVDLDTTWTTWTDPVTLLRDDTRARIHFDVGKDGASVEFADIVLTDLTTGQRVLPDPLPFSLTHHFNDVGCRGPDTNAQSAVADARRVLILGDSYALGLAVRDQDLFGTRLGQLLAESDRSARSAKGPIQVMTCAVPGWAARQERQFYDHLRGRYSPELVIVVATWNDGRLRDDEFGLTDEGRASRAAADASNIAVELSKLADRVRSDGAQFGVVVFRNTPDQAWAPVLDALAPLASVGVPVLDLWPALNGNGPWRELVVDPLHGLLPNEAAHQIAATATVAFLRSQGFVK